MTVLLALLGIIAILVATFIVGWYLVSPAFEWIGRMIHSLAIKGADYHAMVQAYKASGEVQDQST